MKFSEVATDQRFTWRGRCWLKVTTAHAIEQTTLVEFSPHEHVFAEAPNPAECVLDALVDSGEVSERLGDSGPSREHALRVIREALA